MAESVAASTYSNSNTVVLEQQQESATPIRTVHLKLKKPKNSKKKVAWTPDTIDNEHMNKKKSKCCCIYKKPREFDESSSESEEDCENCRGHLEKDPRKKRDNPDLPDENNDSIPVDPDANEE